MGLMNRTLVILAAAFSLLISVSAQADPLDGLLWKKRPLLLFAKSRSDASLDKQVELLRERRPDLRERDMLVLGSEGNQDTIPVIGYTALPRGTARYLRERFEPNSRGLTVILVGKDGTEKARWTHVVDPDEVFDLIDAMPMRRDEATKTSAN